MLNPKLRNLKMIALLRKVNIGIQYIIKSLHLLLFQGETWI